jgi:glycosyltransferase involved in cell wall biosynthesis
MVIFQYWMPFFGPSLGTVSRQIRRTGAEQIAIVHNAIPHERRPGDLALGRYFLNSMDRLITMSSSVTEDLTAMGVSVPVEQIHHPVYEHFGSAVDRNAARESLRIPEGAPTLLFFGFIRKYKGLHVLLESLPQVLVSLPALKLVVAGEFYDDEEFYRDITARNRIRNAVQFHAAYIPTDEVARYFSAADVVVQPYVSATQSGVAQIAFHFHKPMIVTDVGGLAETVPHEKAGLVVPPEDPGRLAAAIIRFFAEDMGPTLTAGVKEEKRKYSWDRLYELIEQRSS